MLNAKPLMTFGRESAAADYRMVPKAAGSLSRD